MALLNLFWDTTDKRVKAGAVSGQTYFVDEDFTLVAPSVEVQLVNNITATQRIDVFINGQMTQEGQTWTRDDVLEKINFLITVQTDAWIRVREWNF